MEVKKLPPNLRVPGETKLKQKEFELEKDLTKLSRRELLDIKERQLKLLENKPWINKLPDKGEKIRQLYDRAMEALKQKEGIEVTENLLRTLKIESKDIENLEWEGKDLIKKEVVDSDDEADPDPVAILATTNSVLANKKIVKHETPAKPLITEQDLQEAKEIKLVLDPVLEHVCDIDNIKPDFRFLPYKNAKVHEHPAKDRENTAATPPVTKQTAILLSLRESIEIENKNRENLKDLTAKHTAERLEDRMKAMKAAGIEITSSTSALPFKPSQSMSKYRLPAEENEAPDSDDNDSYESALSDEYEDA